MAVENIVSTLVNEAVKVTAATQIVAGLLRSFRYFDANIDIFPDSCHPAEILYLLRMSREVIRFDAPCFAVPVTGKCEVNCMF